MHRFLFFLFLIVDTSFAHDFWVEPETFRPEVGTVLPVRLYVGHPFSGETYPRNFQHLKRFVVSDSRGEKDITGHYGSDPAGYIRVDEPGCMVVGYRSNHTTFTLSAKKFEAYLKDEGLDFIARYRVDHNQTHLPVREAFSRCAKAILNAGANTGQDRILGFELELVAEQNPSVLKPGDDFFVRLLYKGVPLKNTRLVAVSKQQIGRQMEAYTNEEGVACFQLNDFGAYLIKCVYMVPAPEALHADWESLWASLTFTVSAKNETKNAR